MGFFEILSLFSILIACGAAWVAVQAIKLNLDQKQQLQQIYQALSALQIYYYEEDWPEDVEEPEQLPVPLSEHKVIDLFTRMPVVDDED